MIDKKYQKNKDHCKVTFLLPFEAAKNAQDVRVVGDFNNWRWEEGLKMKVIKNAYQATVELKTGQRYEFRYQMDNGGWANDWEADEYVSSPFEGVDNCVVSLEAGSIGPTSAESTVAKKGNPA